MGSRSEKLRKYRREWESEEWARGWLQSGAEDEGHVQDAYCKLCRKFLRAHKTDLQKHAENRAHKRKVQFMYPIKQATLSTIIIINDDRKREELTIAAHVAMHSSLKTVDHLGEVINKLLNQNSFKIHRTKCSALIKNVIAPCILDDIIKDVSDEPYSLILDESTDVSTCKYLCICIRYYSKMKKNIVINFLGLVEVEKATANILYDSLKRYLKQLGLNIKNLIGLGTDGGSNLCGRNHSVFTLLKSDNEKIQLIRCICHSIDNASSEASKILPSNLDFMCREIYSWFHCSALRIHEYKRLFEILNNNEKVFHNFVKLSQTRWLCRYNVVKILLEHYEELKIHFKFVVEKNEERCFTAKTLNEMLQDNSNFLYFKILKPILYEINKLNIIFQKNFIEIGNSIDDIKILIMFLGEKILKLEFSKNFEDILRFVSNELAYRQSKDVDFGVEYYLALRNIDISPSKLMDLEDKAKAYIKKLLLELLKRLPDNISHFSRLQAFSPKICLAQTLKLKFNDLPFINTYLEKDKFGLVENQYKILGNVNWTEIYGEEVVSNSYKFWPVVLNHTNAGGNFIFKELAQFALLLLSLPSSNAVVERVFSIMNITKSKIRNRMNITMLNSLLFIKIKFYMEDICCKDFVCTQNMLKKFNNNIYNNTKSDNENGETTETETDDLTFIEVVNESYNVPCISDLV